VDITVKMAPKLQNAVNKSMKTSMKVNGMTTMMKAAKAGPPMTAKTGMKAVKPGPPMKAKTTGKAVSVMTAAATKQPSAMKKRAKATKTTKKNVAKIKPGKSPAAMKRAAVSKKVTTSKKSQAQKPAKSKAAKGHSPFFLPFKYNLENYLTDLENLPKDIGFWDPAWDPERGLCPCLQRVFGAYERNGELVVEHVRVKHGWAYGTQKGRIRSDHMEELQKTKFQQFGIWNGPCSHLIGNQAFVPMCAHQNGRGEAHGPQAYVPAGTAVKSPSGTEDNSLWCSDLKSVAQLACDIKPAFGGLSLNDYSDGRMYSARELSNPKAVTAEKVKGVWNSDRYYFPLFVDSQGCGHVLLVSSDKAGLKDSIVYAAGDDPSGSWHVVEDRGLKTYMDFNFGFCGSVESDYRSLTTESDEVLFTEKHLHCAKKDLDAEGLPKELNGKIRSGSRKEVIEGRWRREVIEIFLHLRELMEKSKTVVPVASK